MITITKAPNGYLAHATPPHVRAEWRTAQAMPRHAIIGELVARGAHQTDIGDAFYEADPDWLKPSN